LQFIARERPSKAVASGFRPDITRQCHNSFIDITDGLLGSIQLQTTFLEHVYAVGLIAKNNIPARPPIAWARYRKKWFPPATFRANFEIQYIIVGAVKYFFGMR
tara:strand:- start:3 stop:314 length:312 start_codon:yes stop_codon:yes gene_type:complete